MSTITVNSMQQLESALQNATSGETLLLSPGDYAGIDLSGVNIAGNVTIASASAAHPAILTSMTLCNCSGFTFQGLTFQGSGLSPFMIENSSNITFTDLNVHGSLAKPVPSQTAYGLDITGCTDVTVSNSNFNHLMVGIEVGASTNAINISNNSFTYNRIDGIQGGVVTNATITDNYFSEFFNAPGDHDNGMQLWDIGNNPGVNNINISNNLYYRGNGDPTQGIFLEYDQESQPCTNIAVNNNLVVGAGYNGIFVMGTQGTTVSDNEVDSYCDYQDWIRTYFTSGATLTGNTAALYISTSDTGLTQTQNTTSSPVTDGGLAAIFAWLGQNPTFSQTVAVEVQGAIDDSCLASLAGTSNAVHVRVTASAVLEGGGTIALNDNATDQILGVGKAVSLTNVGDTITGTGLIGSDLTLINQGGGVIVGTGVARTLVVNTGKNTIINAGVIGSAGAGGVRVESVVNNTGQLCAMSGRLTIARAVTGAGIGVVGDGILDCAAAFDEDVQFLPGATGTLELGQAQSYAGTIAGLSTTGANRLDLSDIAFVRGVTTASYAGTPNGGVLTVTNGVQVAQINLLGNYTASSWVLASDRHGGTMIVDPANPASTTQRFIAAAAGLGAASGAQAHIPSDTPSATPHLIAGPGLQFA